MYLIQVYDEDSFCFLTTMIPMIPRVGEEIEDESGDRHVITGVVYPLKGGHDTRRIIKLEVKRVYP